MVANVQDTHDLKTARFPLTLGKKLYSNGFLLN